MNRWMEKLGTWQFAIFWAICILALLIPGGALIGWLSKGTIDFSFLVPYSFTFALASAVAATIGRRYRRPKREGH
jgi:membrane protein implicated in regulation of membrane protease activity